MTLREVLISAVLVAVTVTLSYALFGVKDEYATRTAQSVVFNSKFAEPKR